MRRQRAIAPRGILLGLVLAVIAASPVLAAVPSNNTLAGATVVSIGDTVEQNTDDATVSDREQRLADFCEPPAVGGAVWFTFTPDADGIVAFNVEESDFSAGVFVYAGTPVAEEVLACGPAQVTVEVFEGETYNIMVMGDGFFTEELTGNLVFKVLEGEPAPELALTVDRGRVNSDGVVRIVGTITCSSESGDPAFIELFGELTQRVGRQVIRGSFENFLEVPCDGSTTRWVAFATGDNGIFAGGKAATAAIAFGCTDFCSEAFAEATIQLRRSAKF